MTAPRTTSSARVDERTGPPGWLAWLVGLLLLALVAPLLVFALLGDDEREAAAAESPFQVVEQGARVTSTGELRGIDEHFLSDLQRDDGADDLEPGDDDVQADQRSSVG